MAPGDKKKKKEPVAPPPAALANMTVAELMAGFNAADPSQFIEGATTQPKTIGAPREVITAQQGAGLLRPDFTPWQDGDEWQPQVFDRNTQARLKSMMNAAGLYGNKGYYSGGWTPDDADALTTVLAFANGQGIDSITEAAGQFASLAQSEGGLAKAPRAPLVAQLPNPESVRQVIRKTSLDMLGRRLSPDEEQRLISGFQNQVLGAQQAEYAAEETGGTVTTPMDAQSYAEAHLENAPGAGAQRYLDAFSEIHKSLTSTITPGPRLSESGAVGY